MMPAVPMSLSVVLRFKRGPDLLLCAIKTGSIRQFDSRLAYFEMAGSKGGLIFNFVKKSLYIRDV